MATREELYQALRNADAAGDADGARKLAAYIQSMPAVAPQTTTKASKDDVSDSGLVATAAGLGKGFGSTVLGAQQLLGKGLQKVGDLVSDKPSITSLVTGKDKRGLLQSAGDWLVKDAEQGRAKLAAELAPYKDVSPIAAGGGELGGEIFATLPVGGVLAKGAQAVGAAPALVNALATGGMRAGTTPGAVNMLTRIAGGAATGGASAALINPDDAGTGAIIGGALPPALAGAGKVAGYLGRAAGSFVKPFTAAGQDEIAGNVIRRFAEGGPTAIDARQIVQGSSPTLAEATGNAGVATLQRGARDLRPNAFVERESQNAAARLAALDNAAGDAGELAFNKASRETAANELYGKALDPANQQAMTPYLKGQITQLLKRPSVDEASRIAQRWAIERGEKPSADGSLRALHDVKTALDDKIAEAVRKGAGGEVEALQSTKAKLLNVMETLSPDYAEARTTYAEMSKPINAMESLQGLKLTDAQGNITLAKVQNAIRGLEQARSAPGANAAKSVTEDQLRTLSAIRDDLLRQSNIGAGRSIGSNTFQNLATDNILNSMAGNTLSRLADKTGVAGALGQVGRLAYSGPNEAIRNRLVDMMLDPQLAQQALTNAPQLAGPNRFMRIASNPLVQLPIYRSAPAIATSR
jgi:hypothetical protein